MLLIFFVTVYKNCYFLLEIICAVNTKKYIIKIFA